MRKIGDSGEFRYFGSSSGDSARPLKPTGRPRSSRIVKTSRFRKRSYEPRPSDRGWSRPASTRRLSSEAFPERLPSGRREPDAEGLRDGLGNAALLEVRGRPVSGLRELGRVKALRGRDRGEELLALLVARAARDAFRNRHPETRGERLDRFGKIEPVDLAHEMDDVAAGAASEAVIQPLFAVDGEGRSPLVVKRTESLPRAPGLLQPRVFAHDLDDVGGRPDFRQHVVVDVEVGHVPNLSFRA